MKSMLLANNVSKITNNVSKYTRITKYEEHAFGFRSAFVTHQILGGN